MILIFEKNKIFKLRFVSSILFLSGLLLSSSKKKIDVYKKNMYFFIENYDFGKS